MSGRFCVDTSAWHRAAAPLVAGAWAAKLDGDELSLCDQVRLEILYSARSARDYVALASELAGLHRVPTNERAFERALEVQHALAHVGGLHHRSVKLAEAIDSIALEIEEGAEETANLRQLADVLKKLK